MYQMVDDNGTPFRDELKTDLSRRFPYDYRRNGSASDLLAADTEYRKKKAAERGIEYNPDNLVFCTRKGTLYLPQKLYKNVGENLRSMGIDHKRFSRSTLYSGYGYAGRRRSYEYSIGTARDTTTLALQLPDMDTLPAKMRNSAAVKAWRTFGKVRNPEAEGRRRRANSVKKEDTVIPFQEGRKLKSAACKIK